MRYANLSEEKKLWKRGYEFVAGLDEAGRGPLAGPVVAAAVCAKRGLAQTARIRDSKQLSVKQREYFYEILIKHSAIQFGVGVVSEKIIDKINIKNAAELAMENALNSLKLKPDYLIIDGNNISNLKLKSYNLKLIVKGDEKVFSCAAASIIAKVTRDRIIMEYHKKYPQYGFDKHKGYPTEYHYQMINKHGPCQIHRKSYTLNK